MQKNCTFYANAAACERAGYRPCLRCRPELAPGNSSVDATSSLVARAVNYIEEGALTDESIEGLAEGLGVSSRHLRRIFEAELGVTPVQFVQTKRLLVAKHLLTDTDIPITQIAMASGFASVRRFNSLFVERYKLNPRNLRKSVAATVSEPDSFNCQLSFRPPYDWQSMLSYLKSRGSAGVELIVSGKYYRTVSIDGVVGWLSVEMNDKNSTLVVTMSSTLAPRFMQILAGVKRLFDLQANPEIIASALGALACERPGLRIPGAFDAFEISIRAILGQQVSVKAATSLARRVAEKYGGKIVTPFEGLNLLTPSAAALANADESELSALGIMPARARTIINFAREWLKGELSLHAGADYESTVAALVALPGIGEWTANYIAMRCLAWPDAFMHGDLGVQKALGQKSKKALLELTEHYRPWRAYATMHLWKSLEENTAGAHAK